MKKYLLILCALLLTAVGASAQGYVTQITNTQATWIGATGTGGGGIERYGAEIVVSGTEPVKVLYQAIGGLAAGTYEVTFYAVANNAWVGAAVGSNIAQAFANETVEDVTVYDQTSCTVTNYSHTLQCTVGVDGILEYGLQNIATGGNWYVCQGVSYSLVSESTPTVAVGELHTCVADIGHWTTTGNNGTFVINDWSTEADASGMKTPFCQNWVWEYDEAGGTLTTATISHSPFTGLPAGYYEVSMDIRIFNELGGSIGTGTTFSANDASEDIDAGVEGHEDTYGDANEVYGTYHLLAQVADAGTLNISIQLPDNPLYGWIAWKNLKVVYDGTSAPTLEAVTGDMNEEVAAAMADAISTYNSSKTSADYTAAMAAIMAAEESIAQYAEIAELAANLDAAGQAVWEASTSGVAYAAKTLATSDDFSADMSAAQKAQTTAGSDLTYALLNSGTWAADQGNGPNPYSTFATETYIGDDGEGAVGKVLYYTVEDLKPGTYNLTFYVAVNMANGVSGDTGDNLAEAYANDAIANITIGSKSGADITSLSDMECIILNCTVENDGVLEFGIEDIGAGGNWFLCAAESLTFGALADDADYAVGDEIEMHNFSGTVASGNLFVNGGFNNGVEGWTAGNKYTDPLSESNVTLSSTGGYNDGPYVTLAATGASDEKTPTQAIAVEPGKSYLLVGYTKYSGTDANLPDSRYSALFSMNDDGTAELSHHENGTSYSNDLVQLQVVNNGEWVQTEGIFTVPAADADSTYQYVGMRMNWSTASYDGLQLYELDGQFTFPDDADYSLNDEVTINGVTYTVVSDNLIENGSFNERTTGWTYGRAHANPLGASQVTYSTDGGYNDGPYITSKGGGSDADTTPSKEVGVKTGKTYLFVGYTNGTTPGSSNLQYNGLFTMSSETSESSLITQMNWNEPEEELNGWTKTEAVFTATTDYVGLRFAWCPGASFDGMQLYQIAESEDIDWDMTEAGWGTLILPFDADVPDGLTLYAGDALTVADATIEVGDASESIAANVPYLVSGDEGTYTFTGAPANVEDSYTVGLLTGTLVDMTQDDFTADGSEYVLQNHDDDEGLAFYPIISGQSTGVTLDAYHCYLIPGVTPNAVKLPGMATAIEAVESDVIANDAIYDLSGRRVAKAVKGVYIMNGKKVLVK